MYVEDELSDEQLHQASKIAEAKVPEIDTEKLANREQMRFMPIRKCRETYRIPFEMIKIREGFNVRAELGDIEELAMGILSAGFHTEPLEVDVLSDQTVYIVDGHRRYRAFELLKSKGHQIIDLECFINDRTTSEEDRIVAMFVSQNNKKLEPLEVAACVMRLHKRGLMIREIAERIGKSEKYVKNYLRYERQPAQIKQLMANGNLSVSNVDELLRGTRNEKERLEFVETNLSDLAPGVKVEIARKGTASFIAERLKRIEEIKSLFTTSTQNKLPKIIAYLKGDLDEVDLFGI